MKNTVNQLGNRWNNASIRLKLLITFALTLVVIFSINLFMYVNINYVTEQVDRVYASNVNMNELSDALDTVHNSVKEYLDTKSSDALNKYYTSEQDYRNILDGLNRDITNSKTGIMEKNIYEQSQTYLEKVYDTVQAKRGRNVEKYKAYYEDATQICVDIQSSIYSLNNEMFKSNSTNYTELVSSLKKMEFFSTIILVLIGMINLTVVVMMTGRMTEPLIQLSKAANEVSEGNFDVDIVHIETHDEIGVMSLAFETMISSIQNYIQEIKLSMEREGEMKARELTMESRMKEAQLRTLQAQINPHFLFNTLNAGAQLAMMEGADKTVEFVENMADFFRYNIKKMDQDATIGEEVRLVDNYIYILNVRFTGEIHFQKEIDESVMDVKVPSMILQPIVENAVNYGIRGIEWEGIIKLKVYRQGDYVYLSISDNGIGMSQEKIHQILNGELREVDLASNSNGIGMGNVIERLRIYTGRNDVMEVYSEGENKGTEFILKVPMHL